MADENEDKGGAGGEKKAPDPMTVEQRMADIEKSNKDLAAQLQTANEEAKRVNGLNSVLLQRLNKGDEGKGMDASRTVPLKLKRDFTQMDPAADPASFARELVLETAEQVNEVLQNSQRQQQEAANLRTAFYTNNKDLVGWEKIVGVFSGEVMNENPNLPFDQAASEIAKRTREFIKTKSLKSDDPKIDPVLPAGGQNGGDEIVIKTPKGGGSEPFNADKEAVADMKDYVTMRQKERDKTGALKPG